MSGAQVEALCRYPAGQTNMEPTTKKPERSAGGRFPDRAWTLPQRVDIARSLKVPGRNRDDIVITHVVRKGPGHGMTEPQAADCAYSARVYLDGFDACDVWRDEQPVPSTALMPGAMLINDMRHTWRANPTSHHVQGSCQIPASRARGAGAGQYAIYGSPHTGGGRASGRELRIAPG